jgi:hypothetical protein
MMNNKVWNRKGFYELPRREEISSRWKLKIKEEGVYQSRLVVKGYNQQAGVEFVRLRVILILWVAI